MGKFASILTALFCAAAPISPGDMPLGKQVVTEVRADYASGQYSEFLNNLDASYRSADLTGLIAMREGPLDEKGHAALEQQMLDLQKEKNRELLAAVSDEDGSPFAEKVRSVAAQFTTAEQDKAISRLHSFLSMKPGSGANADENTLIDIDLEYEYKLLHGQYSQNERLALRMEKMAKMVAASKNFEDQSLKQAVAIGAATLDQRLSRNLDGADLNQWVKNHGKAGNPTEEQVQAILSSYQQQFSDLFSQARS